MMQRAQGSKKLMNTHVQTPAKSSAPTSTRHTQGFALQRKCAGELSAERRLMHEGLNSLAMPGLGHTFSQMAVFGLQRKCACGRSGGQTGTCDECGKKRALGLQTKLTVNEPGDAYEQEADRVAESIMGSFTHPTGPKSEPGREHQRPAESELTNGGEQLLPDVAQFFETRFGRDFSAVRIHTGETATRYNDAVNAYAFTYGNHIWLGPGMRQQPSHILAHELAHVVQQTQPPQLDSAPVHTDLSPSSQGVQRFAPYWMPEEYKAVGTESHAFILPKIGKRNKIFTEAPVPNANKLGEGFDKIGIADLYQASSTVGVFFAGEKRPKVLSSNRELKYKGDRYAHIVESAPQANEESRSVTRAGIAPTDILVGDLKPSHGTIEAMEGPEQVKGYLKGFEFAHKEVNEMDVGRGGIQQTDAEWKPLTTGIIDIQVPEEFKEPIAKDQKARPLKLMHNGTQVDLHRRVMGKVYVRPDPGGGGIWNYIWAPVTRLTATDLPSSVTALDADITAKIIRPLLESPVKGAKKARPAQRSSTLTLSSRRIQARGRDTTSVDVKDPFDAKAFEAWKADHSRLTGEEKQLEKTPAFEEAKYKTFVLEDRQAASKSGFNVPPLSAKEDDSRKTVSKIEFWTGASSAIFGKLRYWFGGAFVKVLNAYHAIRDRFKKTLEGKSSPESGGLAGTILKIAFNILKIVGRIFVERTATELIRSLKSGVERKLKALIPTDKIEEMQAKVDEIRTIADNLEKKAVETFEAIVENTIGPYEDHIKTIVSVAKTVSEVANVVNKVRWGARVIACLAPPGWGCLWILLESVMEKFASWVIDRCWFKQEIAPLVSGVDFLAKLPKRLAEIIIEQIRKLLPDSLHDVFADVDVSEVNSKIPSNEICDENDRDARPRDRFLLEKLALDELRKDIGEEKWEAWTTLGNLYGVNRAEPLSEQQVGQLLKELKKADLTALKEAADLYAVLSTSPASRDVVNLTTFLEHAEVVKQQMYGGDGSSGAGGDGAGGEGGISVTTSEKAVGADYKPSKHRWDVVGGVKRGQFQGNVIKVQVAASIKGTVVTLENLEVEIKGRQLTPNPSNPEKAVIQLEVTRDQYFDIEKEHGMDVVKKIGFKSFRYKAKDKLRPYTLQLK